MKTTFSRIFTLVASAILLCLILLGVSFRLILSNYLEDSTHSTLQKNAETIAYLASVYDAAGELDTRWGDFGIALTAAAQVSGTEAILCEPSGEVIVCSCDDMGCSHRDYQLDPELAEAVLQQEEIFSSGTLNGFYGEAHFIEAMAVHSQVKDEVIGVLVITSPEAQIGGVLEQTTILVFYVSVFVLMIAMIATFLLSRKQSQSIQSVTKAAVRFGRGELDTRVAVGGKNTVEIDELAVAFNTMAESLSQSERQRQEFVANVSHELKTPMTTIAGFMDGMLDGTIPPERHRDYMQLVSDEVRRLSRLVRSMLEISRLRTQGIGEEKKRRFDLCEAVGQVLISFERRVNSKRLHMDVQMPERSVWVKADPDSITQVIYNLTDNAIKFCEEGGRLSIWLRPEGGKARVTIQNTGGTVPAEELPLLFDRFHKADKSRSADREGVGLGLYIVKTILNSHGEDISVTSQDGLTAFTFTLPLVR